MLCSTSLFLVRVEALALGFIFVLPLKVLSGDKRLESASYGYDSHTQETFQEFHVYLCLQHLKVWETGEQGVRTVFSGGLLDEL